MKTLYCFILLGCYVAKAQVPTLDVSGGSVGSYGSVKFNNPAAIGQKSSDKLDYAEVRGKCFWDNDWNPAIMIFQGGRAIKMPKVKLNFYTNDIHYLDKDGLEFVTPAGLVKKIAFFSIQDTIKANAVFESFAGVGSAKKASYFQLLNDGKTQLLKKVTVNLRKQNYDPSIGKDEFRFASSMDFYIKEEGAISHLKGINKSAIFSVVKSTDEMETWLSSNKNKLKNEDDVIAFLNFVNSQRK